MAGKIPNNQLMKRPFLVLLSILLACVNPPLNAQEFQARGQHPRPFFTPEVIAKLKERIKTEPATAEAWTKLLADPKSIQELSLAYRMTGEQRFADKLRGAMGGLRWDDPMLMLRDPPWHAGFGIAPPSIGVNLAAGLHALLQKFANRNGIGSLGQRQAKASGLFLNRAASKKQFPISS